MSECPPLLNCFPGFELSEFQIKAMLALEAGNDCLVCAPTGSGKTLPFEYLLQKCAKQNKRILYLSPIKALSNQKYFDLQRQYPDISCGLCTGDIKKGLMGTCLIMTTEILANRLTSSSAPESGNQAGIEGINELDLSDVAAVTLDECHFINDEDRGTAYETVFIHLPSHIQILMLSATLAEPNRFIKWIESLPQKRTVILAKTTKREVPQQHLMFQAVSEKNLNAIKKWRNSLMPTGQKSKKQFVEETEEILESVRKSSNCFVTIQSNATNGEFSETNFRKLLKTKSLLEKCGVRNARSFVVNSVAKVMVQEDMLPAIVFVFSRKQAEEMAKEMTCVVLEDDSKVPYTIERECEDLLRTQFPSNYRDYTRLPEYQTLVALLQKGVAYHHAHLMPVLKEMVEMLMAKSRIKMLFATETCGIGLNFSIRTAVFCSLHKYDGHGRRMLFPHEVAQLGGRAGRRGKDAIGSVVYLMDLMAVSEPCDYRKLLSGAPQKISSKFKIDKMALLRHIEILAQQIENEEDGEDIVDLAVAMEDVYLKFVEPSLLSQEINSQISVTRTQSERLTQELASLQTEYNTKFSSIDIDVLRELKELRNLFPRSVNRKRKDIALRMKEIEDGLESALMKEALSWLSKQDKIVSELRSIKIELTQAHSFLKEKIQAKIDELVTDNLVHLTDESKYYLSPTGFALSRMCADYSPSLLLTIRDAGFFGGDLCVSEIVAFLMHLTQIEKRPNGEGTSQPPQKEGFGFSFYLGSCKKRLFDAIVSLRKNLAKQSEYSFVNPDANVEHDVFTTCAYYWSAVCTCEEECVLFWMNASKHESFSAGAFTKALLEVSALSKEVSAMLLTWLDKSKKYSFNHAYCQKYASQSNCMLTATEEIAAMEFCGKLAEIDDHILKHVVTMSSLYV
jgi:superfamily II RNA helicase